jgi:hypothetical protein
MPIEFIWLIPEKILLSRWSGDITPDDIRVLVDELSVTFQVAQNVVHTIIDLNDFYHTTPEAMAVYSDSEIPAHPYRGRVAVVGASEISHRLSALVNRRSQRDMVRVFETREEALKFLLTNDTPPPRLPPFPPDSDGTPRKPGGDSHPPPNSR